MFTSGGSQKQLACPAPRQRGQKALHAAQARRHRPHSSHWLRFLTNGSCGAVTSTRGTSSTWSPCGHLCTYDLDMPADSGSHAEPGLSPTVLPPGATRIPFQLGIPVENRMPGNAMTI
ncbi:hypothetical protein UY3_05930 [Chelonia mydas]|uniref:Uncharacterized protein n=1 Tax=Chelonia mydas TaxID=8469 RepID=M7C8F7_CHEMY|nr:hypothetical protein UY3_05930 [Chelonia mydas]